LGTIVAMASSIPTPDKIKLSVIHITGESFVCRTAPKASTSGASLYLKAVRSARVPEKIMSASDGTRFAKKGSYPRGSPPAS
jgi:hypothetical protein